MDSLFIPNEQDFRRWIREELNSCLSIDSSKSNLSNEQPDQEKLLCRKEIAGIFRISLVTLHDWMKRGLPFHKVRGRVYFLKPEVMAYVKKYREFNLNKIEDPVIKT